MGFHSHFTTRRQYWSFTPGKNENLDNAGDSLVLLSNDFMAKFAESDKPME